MKIRTEFVHPPIPDRRWDWSAVDDDTYDGPGSPIGTGPTEEAAIQDLLERIEARDDYLPQTRRQKKGLRPWRHQG